MRGDCLYQYAFASSSFCVRYQTGRRRQPCSFCPSCPSCRPIVAGFRCALRPAGGDSTNDGKGTRVVDDKDGGDDGILGDSREAAPSPQTKRFESRVVPKKRPRPPPETPGIPGISLQMLPLRWAGALISIFRKKEMKPLTNDASLISAAPSSETVVDNNALEVDGKTDQIDNEMDGRPKVTPYKDQISDSLLEKTGGANTEIDKELKVDIKETIDMDIQNGTAAVADGDNDGESKAVLPSQSQREQFDQLRTRKEPDLDKSGTEEPTSDAPTTTFVKPTIVPASAKRRRRTVRQKSRTPVPLRWAGAFVSIFRVKREFKRGAVAAAEALARDTDNLSTSSDDAALADGGAAAAYATAAAIATSNTLRGRVEPFEEKSLLASVSAARAVDNELDARAFVETIGVAPLVRSVRALSGIPQSAALTALANLAILVPKSRIDMLNADNGALVKELCAIVQGPGVFTPATAASSASTGGAIASTEALISGTHLIGTLALAMGTPGRDWRLRMRENVELIRNLKKLSGGLKNGTPEGAARAARRALGALGINEWIPRVPGQRGLRVLSIDGGGTRAIMAFEMLKHMKRMTGCEIHELFDVIGGTSTGAIVAASLGIAHKTVEEVEKLYRELIGKIFAKHPVNAPKMLLTRAYYDTRVLEEVLKRECGSGVFIDSQGEENMNKVFVVSSVMSRSPQELHVFRNYTYSTGYESRYDGTVEAKLWEALRASSAAPTFFSEIRINDDLHADGAIVANNPTAVALHEAKCCYPGVPIELVVSIGNGQAPNDSTDVTKESKKNVGWGEVFGSIVASATSTETVHHALVDLFPGDKYFRFNPTTDSTQIDETRPDQLALFVKDSKHYIKVNTERFEQVAQILRPKTPRNIWTRFTGTLRKEIQVLRATMTDDFYPSQISDDGT